MEFCLIGIILVAIGVSFEVTARVVTLAGEGVVIAICKAGPGKIIKTRMKIGRPIFSTLHDALSENID